MAKASNIMYLEQLFSREAHQMYRDEMLLSEAFTLFHTAANNPLLAEHFERARKQTHNIASTIKEHLHNDTSSARRSALRGILEDGQERASDLGDHHLVDAELIATMQRLLGYQIAGYQNVICFARMLREDELEAVLDRAIQQKRATAAELSEVALHQVHWRANWWAPEHTSSWERVKSAFRRDWEQTKARFGGADNPPAHDQSAGDTLAQMSGSEPVFETEEPAFRYGYGAAQYYRDREWDGGLEQDLRANYGGMWDPAKDSIRAGWDYARPRPAASRSISLPDQERDPRRASFRDSREDARRLR